MENPLILYGQWLPVQDAGWADMIGAQAMHYFDRRYFEYLVDEGNVAMPDPGYLPPDCMHDTVHDDYVERKHTNRLLAYIDRILATGDDMAATVIATDLFEVTNKTMPEILTEQDYEEDRAVNFEVYYARVADGDDGALEWLNNCLSLIAADFNARIEINRNWQVFTASAFNPETIMAFALGRG